MADEAVLELDGLTAVEMTESCPHTLPHKGQEGLDPQLRQGSENTAGPVGQPAGILFSFYHWNSNEGRESREQLL